MLKKKICILITAIALIGCVSIPVTASPKGSFTSYLEGKYLDSQFSQRAVLSVKADSSKSRSSGYVWICYGARKYLRSTSTMKYGSYKLYTGYVYAKQVNSFYGQCIFT